MLVEVKFTLDVDADKWAGGPVELEDGNGDPTRGATEVAADAARHAEFVVRDCFYDNEWIAEHHPPDHPLLRACAWCTPKHKPKQADNVLFMPGPVQDHHA